MIPKILGNVYSNVFVFPNVSCQHTKRTAFHLRFYGLVISRSVCKGLHYTELFSLLPRFAWREREWSRRDEGMKIIIIRTMIRCNVSLMVIIQSIRYSKAKYNIGAERYFCWCFPVSGTMKLLCGSLPCIINRNILPILEYPIGIVIYVWIRLLSMGQCNQIIMNYPWIKADKHSKLKYSH